jgi:hypothetical protein
LSISKDGTRHSAAAKIHASSNTVPTTTLVIRLGRRQAKKERNAPVL